MLGQIRAASFEPVVGIIVGRRVVDVGKMECFASLDARAAAAAMSRPSLVARPRFCKWHAKPRTFADDIGFTPVQEWRFESNSRKTVERHALHRGERVDERRPTVGIDEMITTVDRCHNGLRPPYSGDAEGDNQLLRHTRYRGSNGLEVG